MPSRPIAVAVFALLTAACGSSSSSSPTAPTPTASAPPAAATPLSLMLQRDVMNLGESQSATVTPATTAGTWTASPPIVTVEPNGRITATANGRTAITFTAANGMTASAALRVVPNYAGNWTGQYSVIRCDHSGDWQQENACGQAFAPNRTYAIGFALQQMTTTVTGTVRIGSSPPGDLFSSEIADDGSAAFILAIVIGGYIGNLRAERRRAVQPRPQQDPAS